MNKLKAFVGLHDSDCTVDTVAVATANTKSEALGLLLSAYRDTQAIDWDITEIVISDQTAVTNIVY